MSYVLVAKHQKRAAVPFPKGAGRPELEEELRAYQNMAAEEKCGTG